METWPTLWRIEKWFKWFLNKERNKEYHEIYLITLKYLSFIQYLYLYHSLAYKGLTVLLNAAHYNTTMTKFNSIRETHGLSIIQLKKWSSSVTSELNGCSLQRMSSRSAVRTEMFPPPVPLLLILARATVQRTTTACLVNSIPPQLLSCLYTMQCFTSSRTINYVHSATFFIFSSHVGLPAVHT